MSETGMAGIGRLTLSRRERMVMVEPHGPGLLLITLRAAEEVRAAAYRGELDAEAVAIAAMIIKRKAGTFDPTIFRDRYQDALRELIEAKLKGLPIHPKPAETPQPVFDLMAALKRSLTQETDAPPRKPKRKGAPDRRQRNLLLPVPGGGKGVAGRPSREAVTKRRHKA